MPLFEMSPNVQETKAGGRKRCHGEFAADMMKVDDGGDAKTPQPTAIRRSGDSCEHLYYSVTVFPCTM